MSFIVRRRKGKGGDEDKVNIVAVIAVAGMVMAIIGWNLPLTYTMNVALKATGGCGIGCNRTVPMTSTFCSGLTTAALTPRNGNTVVQFSYLTNWFNNNVTGIGVEIQADISTDLSNNVYGNPGTCGTVIQEKGLLLYFPFSGNNAIFGISATFTSTPLACAPNCTVLYGSLSIRPFLVNGTNTNLPGHWSTRISSITTNTISMQEQV